MDTLELIRLQRERMASIELEKVTEARAYGVSWHRIGVALGLTAEGARQKFAKHTES